MTILLLRAYTCLTSSTADRRLSPSHAEHIGISEYGALLPTLLLTPAHSQAYLTFYGSISLMRYRMFRYDTDVSRRDLLMSNIKLYHCVDRMT